MCEVSDVLQKYILSKSFSVFVSFNCRSSRSGVFDEIYIHIFHAFRMLSGAA